MATPYSDPNLYFRLAPVQTVNWDLAFKALEYKQGQYDTNKLRVDTMLQNYLTTDIIKPEAKQRFVNNIQNLVNEINATGRTDFSDSNISNRVMAHIGQALDASTVSAIAASKQYRQQEAFMQELQTKKPELYNNINHRDMYERKGSDGKSFSDWLEDGDATSTFTGQLNYSPYVNVDKKIDDTVMRLMKENGDGEIQIPDPTDPTGVRMQKWKISGLSRDQLRQVVEYSLTSPEDQAQLSINSRASYNWFKTPEDRIRLQEDLTNFVTPKLSNISASIEEMELKKKTAVEGSEDYNTIQNNLNTLYNNRDYYTKLQTELTASASEGQFDAVASQIYKARYSDAMVNKYEPIYKKQFLGYGVDEYGKWKTEFDFEVQKENNRRIEAAAKAEADRIKKEQESQLGVAVVQNPLIPEEIQELDAQLRTELSELSQITVDTSKRYFSELQNTISSSGDDQKIEEASAILQTYRYRLQTQIQEEYGLSESIRLMEGKDLSTLLEEFDPNGTTFAQTVKDLGGVKLKTSVATDGTNYVEIINSSSSEFIYRSGELSNIEQRASKSLYNEDQTPLLQEISSGQYQFFSSWGYAADLKQMLIKEGILDKDGNPVAGAKLSDSKWAKDVERSFVVGQLIRSNSAGTNLGRLTINNKDREELEKISLSFGENIDNISTTTSIIVGSDLIRTTSSVYEIDPNSKTGKYLSRVAEEYQDRTWVGALFGSPKTSLAGDGKFSSLFYGNKDYRDTEVYKKGVRALYGNLPSSKSISISSQTPEGKFLVQMVNTNTREEIEVGTINESLPIIMNKNSDGSVVLSQKQTMREDGKTVVETVNLGTYTMEEMSQVPGLINRVNWEQQKVVYNRTAVQDKPIKTNKITYWDEYTPVYNANAIIGTDEMARKSLRAVDAPIAVYEMTTTEIQQLTQTVDPGLPQGVKRAINNSSNYLINATIKNEGLGDFVVLELVDTSDRNKVIYNTRYQGMSNLDGVVSILHNTPQVLYTTMISDIIKENYNRNLELISYGFEPEFTPAYKKLFGTQQ